MLTYSFCSLGSCPAAPPCPQIIHRDLKSENILLTGEPGEPLNALICDFGLHKLVKLNLPADSLASDLAPVE